MKSEPIVIVGAGQAAQQAVASLRADGYDGDLILFGEEAHLPYQRPPLSKGFLTAETTRERLELRPAAFYESHNVEMRLGSRIERIDTANRQLFNSRGRSQVYDKLLIATGTRPRRIVLEGIDLAGVHAIRAIRDAERFRESFQPGARLVVIGAGYIGLEVAAKARKYGLEVTVIEALPRILARVASAETAGQLFDLHISHGVRILTSASVRKITGIGSVEGIELHNGETIPADMVLVACGASPNVELASASGIATGDGILVDASTRTSVPGIYAAGDVACFPSDLYGRHIRLESVPNAIDQAKAAASAMLGNAVHYNPVPWFWSDQYESKLQIAGLSQAYDTVDVASDAASGRFSARYFIKDRLIAVDSINDPRTHLLARRELAALTPKDLAA